MNTQVRKELIIEITSEIKRFQSHLDLPDNNKIIFSGIFGIGKTYFLKEFFNSKPDKYELFLLSPVNYSISQNDDIIDYIKYDIAFQLLEKDIDFEKTDFSLLLSTQTYLKENYLDVIVLLAKSFGSIGKSIGDIIENVKKLADKIKKNNGKVEINEKKELKDFIKELSEKGHSIYENNQITQLISVLINKLKENSPDKEIVLLIDDLDRLDPEHVFRILNVFACHFDLGNNKTNENKFGFEKIILVCDIENIRNLFHSKYGLNVDFSGYIDKFFSREIFYFDNREMVSNCINLVLSSIKIRHSHQNIYSLKDYDSDTVYITSEILEELINNNLLNLRTFLKLYDKEYALKYYRFKIDAGTGWEENGRLKILRVFDLLVSFYGSTSSLKNAIEQLAIKKPNTFLGVAKDIQLKKYGFLIALIDFKEYRKYKNNLGNNDYPNSELKILIQYVSTSPIKDTEVFTCTINAVLDYFEGKISKPIDYFPFAPLLKIAFDEYLKLQKTNN